MLTNFINSMKFHQVSMKRKNSGSKGVILLSFPFLFNSKLSISFFLHIRDTKCTFVDKPNEEGNEVHTAILTNLLRPKEYFAKQIYKKSSHWASLKQKAIIFQLSGYTAVIKLLNFIQAPYVHLVFR